MPVKFTGNNAFFEPPRSVLTNLLGAPKMALGIHCRPNYFFLLLLADQRL